MPRITVADRVTRFFQEFQKKNFFGILVVSVFLFVYTNLFQ